MMGLTDFLGLKIHFTSTKKKQNYKTTTILSLSFPFSLGPRFRLGKGHWVSRRDTGRRRRGDGRRRQMEILAMATRFLDAFLMFVFFGGVFFGGFFGMFLGIFESF